MAGRACVLGRAEQTSDSRNLGSITSRSPLIPTRRNSPFAITAPSDALLYKGLIDRAAFPQQTRLLQNRIKMMYQLFLVAILAVAGANASALPSSSPTVCLKACFPSNHVCAEGQFLQAPSNGGQCFACCHTPPPPPSEVCLRACFQKDDVCQQGQYLKAPANEGGCFACCSS